MIWIWAPIVILAVAAVVWGLLLIVNRRGGSGVRKSGRTVYDEKTDRNPDA